MNDWWLYLLYALCIAGALLCVAGIALTLFYYDGKKRYQRSEEERQRRRRLSGDLEPW